MTLAGSPAGRGRVEIRPLAAPAPVELRQMTFPIYRHLLSLESDARHPKQGDRRRIEPLAIGAWCSGEPAGMILAELPVEGAPASAAPGLDEAEPDEHGARVLSVYVKPSSRRQGIASSLFDALERQVRELGYPDLQAVYTTGKPAIVHLERLFARRGWSRPSPRTLSVRFTPEAALASDLLAARRLRFLQPDLEIFPWSELSPQEEQELRRSQEESPWIAPLLVPWRFDRHGFDPSSAGARYRGRVVGWVITHRAAFDVVRFTCSFMREDLRRCGHSLPLYAAVLEGLRRSPCRFCSFVTPFSYPSMVKFIRRRLTPISDFVGETRETRVTFSRASAEGLDAMDADRPGDGDTGDSP